MEKSNIAPQPWKTTTGFTCGYSYSTPLGLARFTTFPQVAPVAIHIQPLWGWHVFDTKTHRFHLWLFIFNPFGVDFTITITTGFAWKAIISLRSLLRFTFNPFGVDTSLIPKPTGLLYRYARYCVSHSTWVVKRRFQRVLKLDPIFIPLSKIIFKKYHLNH